MRLIHFLALATLISLCARGADDKIEYQNRQIRHQGTTLTFDKNSVLIDEDGEWEIPWSGMRTAAAIGTWAPDAIPSQLAQALGVNRQRELWPGRARTNHPWLDTALALKTPSKPMSIKRTSATQLDVRQHLDGDEWIVWQVTKSATAGKDMYGIGDVEVNRLVRWYQLDPLTNTWSGTWSKSLQDTYYPRTHQGWSCGGDSAGSVSFPLVCDGGETLWLALSKVADGGRVEVSINGATNLVNCLPGETNGAAYINVNGSAAEYIVMVSTNVLPAGTNTVLLNKDITVSVSGSRRINLESFGVSMGGVHGVPGQLVPDRIWMHAPYITTYIGTTYTNAARTFANPSGVLLGAFATTNYLYIACANPSGTTYEFFDAIDFRFTTANTTDTNLVVEYYDGAAWTNAITVVDGTKGFSRDGVIEVTRPSDWSSVSVNSQNVCWLRFSPAADFTTTSIASIRLLYEYIPEWTATKTLCSGGSQWEYAGYFKPNVSTNINFAGLAHGAETNSSVAVYVDGVLTALTNNNDSVTGDTIDIEQEGILGTSEVAWGLSSRTHYWDNRGLLISWRLAFTRDGIVGSEATDYLYTSMLPVNVWTSAARGYGFERVRFGDEDLTYDECVATQSYGSEETGAFLFSSTNGYWIVSCQLDPTQANHNWDYSGVGTGTKCWVKYNPDSGTPGVSYTKWKAYIQAVKAPQASKTYTSGERVGGTTVYVIGRGDTSVFE